MLPCHPHVNSVWSHVNPWTSVLSAPFTEFHMFLTWFHTFRVCLCAFRTCFRALRYVPRAPLCSRDVAACHRVLMYVSMSCPWIAVRFPCTPTPFLRFMLSSLCVPCLHVMIPHVPALFLHVPHASVSIPCIPINPCVPVRLLTFPLASMCCHVLSYVHMCSCVLPCVSSFPMCSIMLLRDYI